MYTNDGVIDVIVWWPNFARFCNRTDDWYLVRYLLIGIRCCRDRDVARRNT